MKWLRKNLAPGISLKVSLGLALIVLVACVSSGVAKYYFDKSATLFQTISREDLPLLIAASKLAKEVEGLISDGSELVLSENPLLIESVSHRIAADLVKIQGLISELKAKDVVAAPDLFRRSQKMVKNLQSLVNLKKEDLEVSRRILQVSILMRRIWESLTMGSYLAQEASSRHTQELFVRIFSLLRDVPNISDRQRLKESRGQILELKKRIDDALRVSRLDVSSFKRYLNTLERYGVGEKGVLALAATHLRQKILIQDRLVQNAFLSDELAKQSERVFSKVSTAIHRQSQKVTEEIEWIGRFFLLIPVVIIVSAILIFLFIRRSVIGRILALDQTMKAHVQGHPLPIPVEGVDEIASMAQSVSYFVEKRNESEITLHEARRVAERANQAKSVFLANMSHELRTPLNGILGFTQLLTRSKALSAQDVAYLDTIRQSGEHLLTLINQVLDLSTIEAGRVSLNESDFDLYAMLGEIEDMFRIIAVGKQLSFVFEREETVPRFVRTDPVRLRQILINLLNNALKFTEKGHVTVRTGVENIAGEPFHGEDLPLRLHFEVEDTGTGIAPGELTKIFDAFEQAETGRLAKEGTGLGLTISRSFVELMGGQMTVESEVGSGSLFRFDIHVKTVQIQKEADIYRAMEKNPGVRFVYEENAPPEEGRPGEEVYNWPARCAALPLSLREELMDALPRAHMEAIDSLIARIGEDDPRFAVKLQAWAHNFEYEKILSLMKGACEK